MKTEPILNFCVCCGEPMPEGEMVCPSCQEKFGCGQNNDSLINNLWKTTRNRGEASGN